MQSVRVLLDILVYSTTSALSPVPKVARLGPAGSLAASATAIDVSLAVMVAVRVVFGLLSMLSQNILDLFAGGVVQFSIITPVIGV